MFRKTKDRENKRNFQQGIVICKKTIKNFRTEKCNRNYELNEWFNRRLSK